VTLLAQAWRDLSASAFWGVVAGALALAVQHLRVRHQP